MAIPDRLAASMHNQMKKAVDDDHPNLIPIMDEKNLALWHFLVVNLSEPYEGGEYIFRLLAPDDFPRNPPKLSFLTDNGVFMPNVNICISIGEFHAETGWRPILGMIGFAREVVNGLMNPTSLGTGIGIMESTEQEKRACAERSTGSNQQLYPALMEQFYEFEAMNPNNQAIRLRQKWRASSQLANATFGSASPGGWLPCLSTAFGEDWPLVAPGFLWAIGAPPESATLDPGAETRLSGLLARIAPELRGSVLERVPAVRRSLALGLQARLYWEAVRPETSTPSAQTAPDPDSVWGPRYATAFEAFLEGVSGLSGCPPAVLQALRRLAAAPEAFRLVHAALISLLRAADADKMMAEGLALVPRIESLLADAR